MCLNFVVHFALPSLADDVRIHTFYSLSGFILFIVPPTIPLEILARGPEALKAYNEAIQTGEKRVYQTRLMLVGQERVGKTSLKKALTGKK